MAKEAVSKGGRPLADIDPELVEELAKIHCTMDEIATICHCSVDTLERRFRGPIKRWRDEGKRSLRRVQYDLALSGNVTMLIWLGKQLLNQRDERKIALSRDDDAPREADDDITAFVAREEQGLQQMRLATRGVLQLAMAKKAGSGNGSEPEGGANP